MNSDVRTELWGTFAALFESYYPMVRSVAGGIVRENKQPRISLRMYSLRLS